MGRDKKAKMNETGGLDLVISAASLRSGSTLLQRIFNARKKTLIWGEHRGCVTDFCKIHRNLQEAVKRFGTMQETYFKNGEDPNLWMPTMVPSAPYVDSAVVHATRRFLDKLYEQHRESHDLIGFKEVRYGREELTLLRKCYPRAKIILLVRHPIDCWKSYPKKWSDYSDAGQFAEQWNKNASFYLQWSRKEPNAALIQYEQLVRKDGSVLKTIAEWGRLTRPEIENVMNRKITGMESLRPGTKSPNAPSEAELHAIRNGCRATMDRLGYE